MAVMQVIVNHLTHERKTSYQVLHIMNRVNLCLYFKFFSPNFYARGPILRAESCQP